MHQITITQINSAMTLLIDQLINSNLFIRHKRTKLQGYTRSLNNTNGRFVIIHADKMINHNYTETRTTTISV